MSTEQCVILVVYKLFVRILSWLFQTLSSHKVLAQNWKRNYLIASYFTKTVKECNNIQHSDNINFDVATKALLLESYHKTFHSNGSGKTCVKDILSTTTCLRVEEAMLWGIQRFPNNYTNEY